MALDGFGTDAFFFDELYGGAEEVVEEPPFLGIEVVRGVRLRRDYLSGHSRAIV